MRISGCGLAIILLFAACRLTPRVDRQPFIETSPPSVRVGPSPEDDVHPEVESFPGDPPDAPPAADRPLDELSQVGAAARAILQPRPYRELVVEIDWVTGYPPSPPAVDHLVKVLRSSTRKRVSTRGGSELSAQGGPHYPSHIRALAEKRDVRSGGSIAAIWVVYLDGRLGANRRAAGAAISGTVLAMFPDRLSEAGGTGGTVEAATLLHEMGHLLGLINIGYTSPRGREDPTHPGHSIKEESVMHWSVEAASRADGLPMTFDEDDLGDLRGLAEGSL